jgi:hypothetical protein
LPCAGRLVRAFEFNKERPAARYKELPIWVAIYASGFHLYVRDAKLQGQLAGFNFNFNF